jgi:HD-GYP domain-containing protein (c-di-GMP phosphodiesterase class II)
MTNNKRTPEEILQIVFNYVAKISKERKLDKLLLLLANMGRELTLADRCTLWICDKPNNKIWTKVAHGVDKITIGNDEGLVAYSIKHTETIIIDDAYLDDRFNKSIDDMTGYHTKSVLVIPILNNSGEAIGAYQAINKTIDSEVFSQQDIEYLSLASSYVEKVIESAQLYQEIEQTQKDLILLLGEISEKRSWEVGQHIHRVADYCKFFATKYGLTKDEIELFHLASPMHDIGKIAIEDKILKKPGPLTAKEYETVKTHAQIGYEILKGSPRKILQTAATIAHEHHEKWDGSGYPRGLKREEISVYGRITALADVFDSLSNERCYKEAYGRERIVSIFKQELGKHFEPKLIDIFMDNIDEIYSIHDHYNNLLI